MKFLIIQIFMCHILKDVMSLDYSNYHHGPEQVEHKKPIIPILKFITEQSDKGWKYSYESGNGIHAEETGYIKNKGDEKHESLVQQGTVTYHDEHGHPITLHYIADEHGFRPQGAHLPTPPPIPEEIQKAMEQNDEGQGEEEGVGHIQVNEAQEQSDGKEDYEQAQSYAESQVHSKTHVYESEPLYGNGQGYGQDYRRRQNYGRQGQHQHRRFVIKN